MSNENKSEEKDSRNSIGTDDETYSHLDHLLKKDTRKWCKGKKDIEHDFLVAPFNEIKNTKYLDDSYILYCKKCGKEIDRYIAFPPTWTVANEKPEWLVNYLKNK